MADPIIGQISVGDGATFTPAVSSAGILSWTNNKNLPNPASVDIAAAVVNSGAGTFVPITDGFVVADTNVPTIPSNADLDDYTTPGTYRSTSSTVTATIANTPRTGSAFKMVVMQIGYGSSSYAMQLWFGSGKFFYIRSRVGTTNWGAWNQVAYMENVLPLSGGTMSGAIVSEAVNPSSYTTGLYRVCYTGITSGTAPSSNRSGAIIRFEDANGEALGSLYKYLYSGGETRTALFDTWGGDACGCAISHASDSTKQFIPLNDNVVNLGSGSYRWKQLYAGTTTISTSDERVKDNIEPIPDEVLDAWKDVNWVQYQFKESIAEKGENARIHSGAIAQRIQEAFEAHGLDATRYGLLCYDEWDAEEEQKDEQGNVVQEARPAGNRYSLRYEEALCIEAAYQRRRADRLEERIARLEQLIG